MEHKVLVPFEPPSNIVVCRFPVALVVLIIVILFQNKMYKVSMMDCNYAIDYFTDTKILHTIIGAFITVPFLLELV